MVVEAASVPIKAAGNKFPLSTSPMISVGFRRRHFSCSQRCLTARSQSLGLVEHPKMPMSFDHIVVLEALRLPSQPARGAGSSQRTELLGFRLWFQVRTCNRTGGRAKAGGARQARGIFKSRISPRVCSRESRGGSSSPSGPRRTPCATCALGCPRPPIRRLRRALQRTSLRTD